MPFLEELRSKYNHLDSVKIVQQDELIVLEVQNTAGTAEILLLGAQLISFQTNQEIHPIVWKSKETIYKESTPVRGGIPIIAPWFGDPSTNPQSVQDSIIKKETAPAHGFARTSEWVLEEIEERSQKETRIVFSLDSKSTDLHLWKNPFSMQITYLVGEDLSVILEVKNVSSQEMTLALALHTYFAISDVSNVSIPSFDGLPYFDSLRNLEQKVWDGDANIDREIDIRLQNIPSKHEIIDQQWQRKIIIETKGSASAVLWNPWIEKAKRLSMFGDEEYKKMICIETANILDDVKTLTTGSSHTLQLKISTSSLI